MKKLLIALTLASLLLFAAAPALARPPADLIYIVQPGDTLFKIATRYGVTVAAIVQANGLANPNLIFVGQSLVIPGVAGPSAPTVTPTATPLPPTPTGPTPTPGRTTTPPPTFTPMPTPGAATVYVVVRGDTLWAIAQRFNTTINALMAFNGLANPNLIFVGQTLLIPAPGQPFPTPFPTPTFPPPPTNAPSGRVVNFSANVDRINPGDPVTLSWSATGTSATVCALQPHGVPWPGACYPVPVTGSLSLQTIRTMRYYARFSLSVLPPYGPGLSAYAEVAVPINCPDTWTLGGGAPPGVGGWDCPASPAVTRSGAAERFERGVMYWVSGPGTILVRGDTLGQATAANLFTDGIPDRDPNIVPPPGRYQPVRGFGYTWRGYSSLGDLRNVLGWAIEPEYATNFTYQCNSAPEVTLEVCWLQTPHGLTNWSKLGWGTLAP